MYNTYNSFIKTLDFNILDKIPFKSNSQYCGILEHVSYELGIKYLIIHL